MRHLQGQIHFLLNNGASNPHDWLMEALARSVRNLCNIISLDVLFLRLLSSEQEAGLRLCGSVTPRP